jgi:hypothetical protein
MSAKDVISLVVVVAVAGTATTVALSADDPALPLSSRAHDAKRPDAATTSELPSSLRAVLGQRPSLVGTSSSPVERLATADRGHARDVRALRTDTSDTRRAHAAPARQAKTARARPTRPTRVPRRHTTPSPLVLNRQNAPAPPHAPHRTSPPPQSPTEVDRTAPPPPPPSTSFDDSG